MWSSLPGLRRLVYTALAVVVLAVCSFFSPSASAALDIPVVIAQNEPASSGSGVVTTSTRSFIVEALLVAALFGGALFAICRSSRRA